MKLFNNVAVIGFGTMGGGIAQVIAQSGRSVIVLENEQARIEAGLIVTSTAWMLPTPTA